jgi:hypothetical protein
MCWELRSSTAAFAFVSAASFVCAASLVCVQRRRVLRIRCACNAGFELRFWLGTRERKDVGGKAFWSLSEGVGACNFFQITWLLPGRLRRELEVGYITIH